MPERPTQLDVAAVREALEQATPGPWVGVTKPNGKGPGIIGAKGDRGTGKAIAVCQSVPGGAQRVANTKLLGNAPTWLAALLTQLEERDDELERLREAVLAYKAERDADEWGDDEALLARQMHARDRMFRAAAALPPSTPRDP